MRQWISTWTPIGVVKWIVALLAIIGTAANILEHSWGFAIWIITNSFFMVYNFKIREKPQSFIFAVYFCLAIWGLLRWGMLGK
jgi:hypothetical protein